VQENIKKTASRILVAKLNWLRTGTLFWLRNWTGWGQAPYFGCEIELAEDRHLMFML